VKRKNLVLLLFSMIVFLCIPAHADIVRLKDGKSHEGEIVEENDTGIRLKLEMDGGTAYVTIPADQIRRVFRETPEERERRIEERNRAQGLVKDGDEWVTKEVKAARDKQRETERADKMEQRAPLQAEIEKLRQEQQQLEKKDDAFRESLDESRQRMTSDLRSVVLRLVFCVVIAAIAFTLLKRYFWD
jgi:Skp family chaperone for outer membrane proteins